MAALCSTLAQAQTWPTKPVRTINTFAPGGPSDVLGRIIGERLQQKLGQPFVIENRAGAGGTVGSASVARATPDGYTILLGSIATHALAPGLYPKLPYDPINDFVPITQLTSSPLVLAVPPQAQRVTVIDWK